MTPMPNVSIRYIWRQWHPEAIGHLVANSGIARGVALALANEVRDNAKQNLIGLGSTPGKPNRGSHLKVHGKFFKTDPRSVADRVRVKDATREFPLEASGVERAEVTRVAIVVADHPWSLPYEDGGEGIRSTKFLYHGIVNARNKHPDVVHRRLNAGRAFRAGP